MRNSIEKKINTEVQCLTSRVTQAEAEAEKDTNKSTTLEIETHSLSLQ
jgi:hypothetical protein